MIDNSNLPPGVGADDPHINGYEQDEAERFCIAALDFAQTLSEPEDFDRLSLLAEVTPRLIDTDDSICNGCGKRYDVEIFRIAGQEGLVSHGHVDEGGDFYFLSTMRKTCQDD